MKPLDCKGEVNKCKISIGDKPENETLKKSLAQIGRKGKKRNQRSR